MKSASYLRVLSVQVLYTIAPFFVTAAAFASGPILPRPLTQGAIEAPAKIRADKPLASGDVTPLFDFKKYTDSTDLNKRSKLAAGPRTGGGGNACVMGIIRNTEALLDILGGMPYLHSPNELSKLRAKANATRFYLAKKLTLNGEAKDAINYPFYNTVYVTESFCNKLESIISGTTMSLLYHEYLGLMQIPDADYENSKRFLENYNNEETRIREGTSAFGSFAGDVPADPVRNEKDITVKQARCAKQATAFARAMTVALGSKSAKIFSIRSSEQYEPAGNSFNKVESYYFDQDEKLQVEIQVEDCRLLSVTKVYED